MPYIDPERREYLAENAGDPGTAGELNFCLTWHLLYSDLTFLPDAIDGEITTYMSDREMRYDLINEIVGALECCRREWVRRRGNNTHDDLERGDALTDAAARFYRDVAAPYEDTKIQQNGDVYS